MKNKTRCLLFLTILSICSINNLFATSLKIKCINTYYKCHDHIMVSCSQDGSLYYDDYIGDYYGRYLKRGECPWQKSKKDAELGTSDHCEYVCREYALFIGGRQIDTIEKFLEQVPVTELIKLYDPNMIP